MAIFNSYVKLPEGIRINSGSRPNLQSKCYVVKAENKKRGQLLFFTPKKPLGPMTNRIFQEFCSCGSNMNPPGSSSSSILCARPWDDLQLRGVTGIYWEWQGRGDPPLRWIFPWKPQFFDVLLDLFNVFEDQRLLQTCQVFPIFRPWFMIIDMYNGFSSRLCISCIVEQSCICLHICC